VPKPLWGAMFARRDGTADVPPIANLWNYTAMGFDLASIHAASPHGAPAIKADLAQRPRGWLNAAASTASTETRRDFREWQKSAKRS